MMSCMIAANAGRFLWRWISPIETRREGRLCARIGAIVRKSAIMTSFLLVACTDGGIIEVGSNMGWTGIDRIIRREGHVFDSHLSREIRAFLVAREEQGGAAAVEVALSEAGASCLASNKHIFRCEIMRSQIMRSADLLSPRHVRTDWAISVSYNRHGSLITKINVTSRSKAVDINL